MGKKTLISIPPIHPQPRSQMASKPACSKPSRPRGIAGNVTTETNGGAAPDSRFRSQTKRPDTVQKAHGWLKKCKKRMDDLKSVLEIRDWHEKRLESRARSAQDRAGWLMTLRVLDDEIEKIISDDWALVTLKNQHFFFAKYQWWGSEDKKRHHHQDGPSFCVFHDTTSPLQAHRRNRFEVLPPRATMCFVEWS